MLNLHLTEYVASGTTRLHQAYRITCRLKLRLQNISKWKTNSLSLLFIGGQIEKPY